MHGVHYLCGAPALAAAARPPAPRSPAPPPLPSSLPLTPPLTPAPPPSRTTGTFGHASAALASSLPALLDSLQTLCDDAPHGCALLLHTLAEPAAITPLLRAPLIDSPILALAPGYARLLLHALRVAAPFGQPPQAAAVPSGAGLDDRARSFGEEAALAFFRALLSILPDASAMLRRGGLHADAARQYAALVGALGEDAVYGGPLRSVATPSSLRLLDALDDHTPAAGYRSAGRAEGEPRSPYGRFASQPTSQPASQPASQSASPRVDRYGVAAGKNGEQRFTYGEHSPGHSPSPGHRQSPGSPYGGGYADEYADNGDAGHADPRNAHGALYPQGYGGAEGAHEGAYDYEARRDEERDAEQRDGVAEQRARLQALEERYGYGSRYGNDR